MNELTKENVELKLMLGEFSAEIFGKTFTEGLLPVFALFRIKTKYSDEEVNKKLDKKSIEKALKTKIIREINSDYELTDFGGRIGKHYHSVCKNLMCCATSPSDMSQESFQKYRKLAETYLSSVDKFLFDSE